MKRNRLLAVSLFTKAALAVVFGFYVSDASAMPAGVSAASYEITQESGFGTPDVTDSFGPTPFPVWPPSGACDRMLADENNTSRGTGGAGRLWNAVNIIGGRRMLASLSQDWVDAPAQEAAELIMDFNVTWEITDGWGGELPTARWGRSAGVWFPLLGNVSENGWVRFTYDAFLSATPGGVLGAVSDVYFNDTPLHSKLSCVRVTSPLTPWLGTAQSAWSARSSSKPSTGRTMTPRP